MRSIKKRKEELIDEKKKKKEEGKKEIKENKLTLHRSRDVVRTLVRCHTSVFERILNFPEEYLKNRNVMRRKSKNKKKRRIRRSGNRRKRRKKKKIEMIVRGTLEMKYLKL